MEVNESEVVIWSMSNVSGQLALGVDGVVRYSGNSTHRLGKVLPGGHEAVLVNEGKVVVDGGMVVLESDTRSFGERAMLEVNSTSATLVFKGGRHTIDGVSGGELQG